MFPSFYPPKKKGPSSHPVASSIEYVYGDQTSSGHERIVAPEFVAGVDREVLEAIGRDLESLRASPATIGSLNFEERVTPVVRQEVTESFFDYVYLGIDRPRRLDHAVGHVKRLKVSGLLSTDVHFLFLNQLTDSERLFLPYVRSADSYGFYLWTELTNYRFGLSSPFDPARRRIAMPRVYGSDTAELVELKRDIGAVAADAFASGRLTEPRDVLDLLLAHPGVLFAKHTGKGVLIQHELTPRAIRLNALIFSETFDGNRLRERLAKLKRIRPDDCEAEFRRIAQARAQRQWQRFGLSRPWIAPRFNLQSKICAQPEFFSPHGRVWARALDLDAKYGSSLELLGGACDQVSRRLAEIGDVLGDCLEDAEQAGGGRGSIEEAASRVRAAVAESVAVGQGLRRAVDASRRPFGQPRDTADRDRSLRHLAYRFNGAVHRVGRDLAGLPGSVREVIKAAMDFLSPNRARAKPKAATWFIDAARTVLREDIWSWLKQINSTDADDVREVLDAKRESRMQMPLGQNGCSEMEEAKSVNAPRQT